jgi:hypothetical protein
MTKTTWAVLGSVLIVGTAGPAVLSTPPRAEAAEVQKHAGPSCPTTHIGLGLARSSPTPANPAPAAKARSAYLVQVRMGWAS